MPISIGLSVYNSGPFLPNVLRSIFAQTCQDWELIIIDDGSTDDSWDIINSVRDPRVKVYGDGVNRGLSSRLNQIANMARGKYLVRMDADDLMHPERIDRQLAFLKANPKVDLLGTAAYSIDRENNPVGVRGLIPWPMTPRTILDRGPLIHASLIGKTEWFRTNQYSNVYQRCDDRELFCRTHRHSTFAHLPEPLYIVREVGTVTLAKYIASCRVQKILLRQYGREMIGTTDMLALILKTTMKELIYRFCFLTHTEKHVIKRRNNPLNKILEMELRNAMQTIFSTYVPGLDSIHENKSLGRLAS